MLISEAFEKTADTLDRVGWYKRGYYKESGSLIRLARKRKTATKDNCHVCALGAAMLAGSEVFYVVDASPARALFSDLFGRDIATYNDTVARDKRQVVRALRKASKKAKAQGI